MRPLVLSFLTFILVFTSCKDKNDFSNELTVLNISEASTANTNENIETLTEVLFPVKDLNQQVIGAYPFRSNWSLGDNEDATVYAKNTSGAKVFHSQSNYFWDYGSSKRNDEFKSLDVQIEALDLQIKALKSVETIIKEEFIPFADSLNIKLTHQYEIPELMLQFEKHDSLYMFLSKPTKTTTKVIATEWLGDKGIKSIAVINHYSKVYENETSWGYSIQIMESSVTAFESAKASFLNSLKNYKPCYQFILDENKKALAHLNSTRWNQTCQYFTLKEKQEKRNAIWKEQERTGTFQNTTVDDYLEHLKSKGFLIDMDSMDVCNLEAYKKQQKDSKRNIDSLIISPSVYIPSEDYGYDGWTQLSD